MRRCIKCNEEKSPSGFYLSRDPKKQANVCRACQLRQQRERYASDPKVREQVRLRVETRRKGLASSTLGRPKRVYPRREAPDEVWLCVRCREEKAARAFYVHRNPAQQNYVCRACIGEEQRERYRSDPEYRERVKARAQARYDADPEARRREGREFYAKHKERWIVYAETRLNRDPRHRWVRSLRVHGLTVDQYEEMLNAQDGLCAICFRLNPVNRPLCVDHDHATGAIRALLCNPCNAGIGSLSDSIPRLESAIAYLRRFGA